LFQRTFVLRNLQQLQTENNALANEISALAKLATDTGDGIAKAQRKAAEAERIAAELKPDIERLFEMKKAGDSTVFILLPQIPKILAPYSGSARAIEKKTEFTARIVGIRDAYQQGPTNARLPSAPDAYTAEELKKHIAVWEQDEVIPVSQLILRSRALTEELKRMQTALETTTADVHEEYARGAQSIEWGRNCLSIETLIEACDYQGAQTVVSGLGQGIARDRLQEAIDQGKSLEAELRAEIETARGLYRECRLNPIGPILDGALKKAQCDAHIRSIKNKQEILREKTANKEVTLRLFDEANTLYKQGEYTQALDKLKLARQRTTCVRFRDSLGRKIAMVESAMAPKPDTVAPAEQVLPAGIPGMLYTVWMPPYGPGTVCLTAAEAQVKQQEGNQVVPLNEPCVK